MNLTRYMVTHIYTSFAFGYFRRNYISFMDILWLCEDIRKTQQETLILWRHIYVKFLWARTPESIFDEKGLVFVCVEIAWCNVDWRLKGHISLGVCTRFSYVILLKVVHEMMKFVRMKICLRFIHFQHYFQCCV